MSSHTTEEHEELIKSVGMRAHLLKDHELDLGAVMAHGYCDRYLQWTLHDFENYRLSSKCETERTTYDVGSIGAPDDRVLKCIGIAHKVVVIPKLFVVVPTSSVIISNPKDGIKKAFSDVEKLKFCEDIAIKERTIERGWRMCTIGNQPLYSLVLPDPAAPGGKVQCLFMMEWATPLQTIDDMGLTPDLRNAHAAAFLVRLNRLKDIHPTSLGKYLRIITDGDGASLSTDLVSQVRTAYAEMSLVR